MSFSQNVKSEISVTEYSIKDAKAFLYGYILLKGELGIEKKSLKLTISSTTLSSTRKIVSLLKLAFNIDADIVKVVKNKLNKTPEYKILVTDEVKKMLIDLSLSDDGYYIAFQDTNKYDEYKDKVLSGMFLARGSINDPAKLYYHLEIVTPDKSIALYVIDALVQYGIVARYIERSKGVVVYIKKSEDIGDFLKVIGVSNELFKFEDARIKKDYNNYINRLTNCDMANSQRTVVAQQAQLEAIEIIEKTIGFASVSPRLMEGIVLRSKYPDATLQELSEVSVDEVGRYIPKSTLCHIMNDLINLSKVRR